MFFKDFIKNGDVVSIRPDRELAKSLIRIAQKRMALMTAATVTEENSFHIVEDCYEAIREVIDALMATKGYKSYSHEASIEFLRTFYLNHVATALVFKADRYRRLRNDIKYRGLLTSKDEGLAAIRDSKEILKILLTIAKREGIA